MEKRFDLVEQPNNFPAAIERAARLGQLDAMEQKPRETSTSAVAMRVAIKWYNGQLKPLKQAYNGGYWNGENALSGKL